MEQAHHMSVLCDTHTIPILMFLSEHGPCVKSDIYRTVGRNANMPRKLETLESVGLISIEDLGNRGVVSLTDLGERVARELGDIDDLMSGQ